MPKFSANLSMLFTEQPFLDRFEAASRAGFSAVEFMFPYDFSPQDIRRKAREAGLEIVLFNMPSGRFDLGERGLATLPDREEEFRAGVVEALRYAEILETPRLNCLAGIPPAGSCSKVSEELLTCRLAYAVERAADVGVVIMPEFINNFDMPGFFLNSLDLARQVISRVGSPHLRMQFDVYHARRIGPERDLLADLQANLPLIEHIQIADCPGRHEPGSGEIDFPGIFARLDREDYPGWVGLEYHPQGRTRDSFGWLEQFRL